MFFVLLNVNLLDSVLTRTGQSESDQPHVKQSVVSLSLWNIDVCCGLFCTGCARRIFCFEIMFYCAEWKQKEEIHFIKNHNTEHNRMTCSEAPQPDEQTCDSLRTSVLLWLWLNMLVRNWNLQLIQSCCKVKICGFNSQSVMNEGCFTCPASVWRVVVKNLPTRHMNGAVWRHRVDETVRSQ